MGLQSNCQTTSFEERVKVTINQKGDTLVEMHYNDAKVLLEDVLHYEYADSLLTKFKKRDSLNTEKITLQKTQLDNLTQQNTNLQQMLENFDSVIANNDKEKELLENTIKQQKKEIRKQKFLKVVGFSAAVILPILTLLALA
jgi:hypothetical protein